MGGDEMTLVDTSSWVEFLRGRTSDAAVRVRGLLRIGHAGWCEMVEAELWNGARNGDEMRTLREVASAAQNYPITPAVWHEAFALAQKCRRAGVTAPVADVIIAACAFHYGLEIESCDEHFPKILKARGRK